MDCRLVDRVPMRRRGLSSCFAAHELVRRQGPRATGEQQPRPVRCSRQLWIAVEGWEVGAGNEGHTTCRVGTAQVDKVNVSYNVL